MKEGGLSEPLNSDASDVSDLSWVARNSSLLLGSSVAVLVLSFMHGVLAARWLGAEGRGELYIAVLTAVTIAQILSLSLGTSIQFHVGRGALHVSEGLGIALLYAVAIGVAVAVVTLWATSQALVPIPRDDITLVLLALLLIPVDLFTQTAYPLFVATNRVLDRAILEVAEWAAALALLVLFVLVGGEGVTGALKSIVMAGGIAAAATMLVLGRRAGVSIRGLSTRTLLSVLTFGLRHHGGAIAARAMKRADSYLLLYFLGARSVGVYSAAVSLAELPLAAARPLQTLVFSLAGTRQGERAAKMTATLVRLMCAVLPGAYVVFAVIGLWSIGPLYGPEFADAALPFVILLGASLGFSLYVLIAGYIAGTGRPELPTYAMLVGAVVNVGLSLVLIPAFGLPGDALATVVGAAVALALVLRQFTKLSGFGLRATLVLTRSDQSLIASLFRPVRSLLSGRGH